MVEESGLARSHRLLLRHQPFPSSVSSNPAAFSAATKVVNPPAASAVATMFLFGVSAARAAELALATASTVAAAATQFIRRVIQSLLK